MTLPIPTTAAPIAPLSTETTARAVSDATGESAEEFRDVLTVAFGRAARAALSQESRPLLTAERAGAGQDSSAARGARARLPAVQARDAERGDARQGGDSPNARMSDGTDLAVPAAPSLGDGTRAPSPWGSAPSGSDRTVRSEVEALPPQIASPSPRPFVEVEWEALAQGDGADRPYEQLGEYPSLGAEVEHCLSELEREDHDHAVSSARPVHAERTMTQGAAPIASSNFANGVVEQALPETEGETRVAAPALSPALRTRLERVIERMAREFGYTVEVVETHRSQERQDALFAQGRTAPGPVVTWTRASRHTDGEAADVRIDGGWNDLVAFQRLARVAREEGLRSLWPRDPGHLELPREAAGSERADARLTPDLSEATGREERSRGRDVLPPSRGDGPRILPIGVPRPRPEDGPRILPVGDPRDIRDASIEKSVPGLARVAAVAEVARVATPAAIAVVAQPGSAAVGELARRGVPEQGTEGARPAPRGKDGVRRVARSLANTLGVESSAALSPSAAETNRTVGSRPAVGAAAAPPSEASSLIATARPRGDASVASDARRQDTEPQSAGADVARAWEGERPHAPFAERATLTTTSDRTDATALREAARADTTERIARVLRLQEGSPDRPLSSVVLRLDAPDGREDRIRVGLRGTTVDTTFDVRDRGAADHMRLHTNELQRALERQGLDGEAITVRTTPSEPSVASLAAGAERDAARASAGSGSSSHGSGRDGRAPARSDDPRRDAEDHRSRDRRSPKGDR